MDTNNNQAYSTITCDDDKFILGNQFLLAFKKRDWNLLRSIITDDCTWSIPGNGDLSGDTAGGEDVIGKAKRFVEKLSIHLDHIQYSLNCVALAICNKSCTGDPGADEHIATVNTVRDGKISSISSYFSNVDGAYTRFAEWAN